MTFKVKIGSLKVAEASLEGIEIETSCSPEFLSAYREQFSWVFSEFPELKEALKKLLQTGLAGL